MRIALTVLLCAAALGVLAGPASALEFTDWTARTDSAVTGSLLGHPVTLTGPTTVGGDVLDGISQVFDYDLFTPRPPRRPARPPRDAPAPGPPAHRPAGDPADAARAGPAGPPRGRNRPARLSARPVRGLPFTQSSTYISSPRVSVKPSRA